jgi:hypothetical protein
MAAETQNLFYTKGYHLKKTGPNMGIAVSPQGTFAVTTWEGV